MKLRGIEFGNVFMASGALNFFGQGWYYHKLLKLLFNLDFTGSTFIAKTTPLHETAGNLRLRKNLQPVEFFPDCVRIYPFKKVVLNAVGLSSPGAWDLFKSFQWQRRKEPFFISFMATSKTRYERLGETETFIKMFKACVKDFEAKVGLELNVSCPNLGHDTKALINEAVDQLKVVSQLGIPLVLNINALIKVDSIKRVVSSGLVDAISCTNAIPWGALPDKINWQGLFGKTKSPLIHYGGGALSGEPLFEVILDWLIRVRSAGVDIPIIAGGGILKESDVYLLKQIGADAVKLGTVIILRPWRVKRIIDYANKIFS